MLSLRCSTKNGDQGLLEAAQPDRRDLGILRHQQKASSGCASEWRKRTRLIDLSCSIKRSNLQTSTDVRKKSRVGGYIMTTHTINQTSSNRSQTNT